MQSHSAQSNPNVITSDRDYKPNVGVPEDNHEQLFIDYSSNRQHDGSSFNNDLKTTQSDSKIQIHENISNYDAESYYPLSGGENEATDDMRAPLLNSTEIKKSPEISSEDTEQKKTCLEILSYITSGMDATAYGVLSFSAILTTAQNFWTISPETLQLNKYLAPLAVAPLVAILGEFAVNITENKELVDSLDLNVNVCKRSLKYLIENPAHLLLILLGGAVDGVVFSSSLEYSLRQFGYNLDESTVASTIANVCAFIIGLQFMVVNGKQMLEYIRKGYSLHPYDGGDWEHNYKGTCARFLVNLLPMLSGSIVGLFGAMESYEKIEDLTGGFEPDGIAKDLAWAPTAGLWLTYSTFNYFLFGIPFKQWLAHFITKRRGISEFKNESSNDDIPDGNAYVKILRVCADYTMRALLTGSAIAIGYGTLDQNLYRFIYDEPYPEPFSPDSHLNEYHETYAVWIKSIIFTALLVPSLGLERYIGQGLRFHEFITHKKPDYKKIDTGEFYKDPGSGTYFLEKILPGSKYYSLDKLANDVGIISFIGAFKLLIDWKCFCIPTDRGLLETNFTQFIIPAMLTGIAGFLVRAYRHTLYPENDLVMKISVNNFERRAKKYGHNIDGLSYDHRMERALGRQKCGFFLMSPLADTQSVSECKVSNLDNIYLYRDPVNKNNILYRYQEDEYEYLFPDDMEFPQYVGFTSTPQNLVKCYHPEIIEPALDIISERGHAFKATCATMSQMYLAWTCQQAIAVGCTTAVHYGLNLAFSNAPNEEENAGLATNQIVSALTSGAAVVVTYRNWDHILNATYKMTDTITNTVVGMCGNIKEKGDALAKCCSSAATSLLGIFSKCRRQQTNLNEDEYTGEKYTGDYNDPEFRSLTGTMN